MGIIRPVEAYHGRSLFRPGFEGWYFKQVSADGQHVWSFIPGVAHGKGQTAFVQAINGRTGETWWYAYDQAEALCSPRSMDVRIGKSRFTPRGMHLDLEAEGAPRIQGDITFEGLRPWKPRFMAPGIMGWYSYVPFMECKHGLVSMDHGLTGSLTVARNTGTTTLDFSGGRGYIEKDWGTSFPRTWLWLQCNTFPGSPGSVSVMLSVAVVPWLGRSFVGHLGFVMVDDLVIPLGTWAGSRIKSFARVDDSTVELEIWYRDYVVQLQARSQGGGFLRAPKQGLMANLIKESVDSVLSLRLSTAAGTVLFEGEGNHAGMELMDGITEAWAREQDR